jgi:hypothetical protein
MRSECPTDASAGPLDARINPRPNLAHRQRAEIVGDESAPYLTLNAANTRQGRIS